MPPPGAEAYQQAACRAVGNSEAAQNAVAVYWGLALLRAGGNLALAFLYCLRDLVRQEIGRLDEQVALPAETDITQRESTRLSALRALLASVDTDLKTAQAQLSGAGLPAAGAITRQAPLPAPRGWAIDANDPAYKGSPYGWTGQYGPLFPGGQGP